MELFLEYAWVLLVLVALEGLLAADNALVLAIMVKHLPEDQRKKALFYGLLGAFVFRLASLFIISFLVDVWQVQALGALYLLYISINHVVKHFVGKRQTEDAKPKPEKPKKQSGFWMTVLKVEVADIAFAVDSILAAVALAVALPPSGIPEIGGLDGGQFIVIFLGGFIGLVIMRFAATFFVKLLQQRPGLELAAFVIVGWVGVKLAVITLAHPDVGLIDEHFPHNAAWKASFYIVLVLIAVVGWFASSKKEVPAEDVATKEVEEVQPGKDTSN
ncbi:TerC family protein [Paenibacillus urinalis]|uniref:TerC family protein n=1 Tax=Paenibacillus urinalis TaxID=521520 RepID=A0AAX3N2G8_9BACL|nr:TerC family protein [Paenibacillus urinalis]WDH83224.1 TerC family protein [Paenibacillus urinalis]WDH99304.1 TerC family protein [Paenibacillus urinalis]WDI02997.1 TerC family protein [Paenibacillus urinalis]